MLINSKRQPQKHARRMLKQSALPSRQQLRGLFLETGENLNSLVELPFGVPPENYSLTVLRERSNTDCQWTLYRGEGSASALEWIIASNDWEQIHARICAQCPGLDVKGKVFVDVGAVSLRPDDMVLTDSGSFLPSKSTLEGDLRNMQVPNLLQSITMGSKLTGRLQIKGRADTAMVFFVDGNPVHATMKGVEGEEAIIELMGWDEGQFCFFPEPKTETKTITKRLDFLIMEGCKFVDQFKSLSGKGFNFDAIIVRCHQKLTEKEFEELLKKGIGLDVNQQKQFYVSIDNHSSLFEILRNHKLSKIEWVPILFNLVNCGLIKFLSQQQHDTLTLKPEKPSSVDWSQMRLAEKALLRPDSGLYTFPAFLYFLDKEFCRYSRFNRAFSIVVLKIGLTPLEAELGNTLTDGKQYDPLPIRAVRAMGQTIVRIKRQVDILAHYQALDYALLLPETNLAAAENFTDRLADVLKYAAFDDIGTSYIDFAIGVSCIPDDCPDVDSLVALALKRVETYEHRNTQR